ncbi:hypothetical protein PVAG01_02303 [Phlyctema vagabunda]|uniref:T6SS Phospholipase effector Tle1-like catalytic domain-containing protein n=1 Tax=Phlyctema vagabunda TaxID=108571 RepID=A0ABR4PQU5_9HELO
MPKADSLPSSPTTSLEQKSYDGILGSAARNGKRLIVLCDGTWQNAESSPDKRTPPTNIIRMARAIKPATWITEEVDILDQHGHKTFGNPKEKVTRQIDQIVFYQSGVGTGVRDRLTGGSLGLGLSEKVRGAYAFLANNYVRGDRIFIFGFSRGAYTARAVAGLISKMGLLDKRGMDNFPEIYKRYWQMPRDLSAEQEELLWAEAQKDYGILPPDDGLIEAMGVFDTVGFHRPFTGKIAWLDKFLGEEYELRNTELPPTVRHAFQALSLDETRFAFKPTLWHLPKKSVNGVKRNTVLKQCWFSGGHSDVGGGEIDPSLSDVSLAWMISELTERKLLAFDPEYLLEVDNLEKGDWKSQRWAPNKGEGGKLGKSEKLVVRVIRALAWFFYLDRFIAVMQIFMRKEPLGMRTPGMYQREGFRTNEFIHASIQDRKLERLSLPTPSDAHWPCDSLNDWVSPQKPLKSFTDGDEKVLTERVNSFDSLFTTKTDSNDPRNSKEKEADKNHRTQYWRKIVDGQVYTLRQTVVSEIELRCRNNIRSADPKKVLKFSRDYGRKYFQSRFHDLGMTKEEAEDDDWHDELRTKKAAKCHNSPEREANERARVRHDQMLENSEREHRELEVERELNHQNELEQFQKREKAHHNQLGLHLVKKGKNKGRLEEVHNDYGSTHNGDNRSHDGVTT